MRWFYLVFIFFLVSCGQNRQQEVERFVEEVRARSLVQIEPLPEVKPYETFVYSAQSLRSPFEMPVPQVDKIAAGQNGLSPDQYRRKELLESFALDSLKMVGSLEQKGGRWALIKDPSGALHRIQKGSYVGQNHGKITSITEEKIQIKEIIPDMVGGWREREASMTLIE